MYQPALFLLIGLLFSATAMAESHEDALDPQRQAELETLLYQDCGSCHGMTLRGGLGPALPRDRMEGFTVEALAHIILHGIPGSAMPGWKALISEEDARWIADHLRKDNPLETLNTPD
ncbi:MULTISPECIES: c-type cytochrome [Halomonas]|uniref:Cbb3-type cytochrome c oxidase subunit CcoP2 n=1 Tax=Halomonas chromatireducens TaxID=507626 RepID=A0A109ULM4_9GAMM|nr:MULTISPECIES: cytochrome c [Halomonas]AMD00773.1 Cbb3-type cytochrome c oxidase subunit CcoP2 [Halomonas chromatireducens]MBZ0330910.1 cytochrome c [Halomonas sp. ANAO-440]